MITTHPDRRTRPARRILGSTAGAITLVIGSLMSIGALALLVLFGPSGTLGTGIYPPIVTSTAALVVDPGTVTDTAAAARVLGAPTVRISATSDGTPVFLGIGRAADVDRYLDGVATDQAAASTDGSAPLRLVRQPGRATASSPTEQSFWITSATSPSIADLIWPIQDGAYRIVVMHVDGTPGVTTQVRAEVTVPNMFGFSLGVLSGGLLLAGGGIAVLIVANRRRQTSG